MMAGYLLDTNQLSAALSRTSRVRERLHQAVRAGHRLGTCIPVLCELETGIVQSARPEANRRALDRLLSQIRLWPMERGTAEAYADVYLELRRRGAVLSQVDIMLAALARVMNVCLLTTDRDFEAVEGIRTENWVP